MRALRPLLVIGLLVAGTPAYGQEASAPPPAVDAGAPSVTATAAKTEVTVGEPFTVEVSAGGPAGTTWTFPADASSEQVDVRTPASADGEQAPPPGTHRYEAAAFALSDAEVPPIEVRYRLPDGTEGTVATSPIPLRILSVLPKDPDAQKLADIRGPVALSIGRAFWLAMALAVLLLVAAAYALVRRRRRAQAAPRPALPTLPPDAAALAAVDRLAASGLLARGEFRAFYIELAVIAKRYLEERLAAPVLEMTSAEAVAFLRDHPAASELAAPLRDLALAADRVKFARGAALVEEGERHLAAVRAMVTTLEGRLRPVAAEGEEGAKVA